MKPVSERGDLADFGKLNYKSLAVTVRPQSLVKVDLRFHKICMVQKFFKILKNSLICSLNDPTKLASYMKALMRYCNL